MMACAAKPQELREPDDESLYSDCDPDPNRVTRVRRRRPARRANGPNAPISARLEEIAQPNWRSYQHLYYMHGWALDPMRAARIRRKLDDINVMTLEELEDQLANRARQTKEAAKKKRRETKQTLDEFSEAKLEEMFMRCAKDLTKRIIQRPMQRPLIVSAATKKLIDGSKSLVANAMESQLRTGGVRDLNCGCPKMAKEERQMRDRVAQEIAMIAKQAFFQTHPMDDGSRGTVMTKCSSGGTGCGANNNMNGSGGLRGEI